MGCSTISLRVAAKTKTKELIATDPPPSVEEANTTGCNGVLQLLREDRFVNIPDRLTLRKIHPYIRERNH